MSSRIPVRFREEFVAFMEAHNRDDLPDGAWFQVLQDAAQEFINQKRLNFKCANDCVHQFLALRKNEKT